MSLEEKGERILKVLEELKEKRKEIDKLYAALEFQAILMIKGIDPQEVKGTGFSLKGVEPRDRYKYYNGSIVTKNFINVLKMKDGSDIELKEPIRKP